MPLLPSTHRRQSLIFPNVISFLICLLALSSCIQQAESNKTTSLRIRQEGTAAGIVAFGFDLGQSYGTSAARFENGTTIPLAKVRGSAAYTAAMEQLIHRPTTHRLSAGSWLSLFRALKRSLGLIPSHESTVLAEMITALKTASEAALQTQIEALVVTAPWMLAWVSQIPDHHPDFVVNDALLLAGLEPWPTDYWFNEENYLGEINTVLASEDRWACKMRWCAGHGMDVSEEADKGGSAFFVSFTNHSLYTSFQRAGCYFSNPWDNHLALIDPRYGLDRESQASSPAQFWDEFKENLLSLVKQHAMRDTKYNCLTPFIVMVAGEAADTPEFLDIMHDVVRAIPRLCASKSKSPEWVENGKTGQVEFLIPHDLTYGAAKGAAIWLRRRMDWTYCAEEGIVDQYDMMRDMHAVEL
ncbi:hypothetical protein V495_01072 [Pseudogymnoascus sp. VKM F-4514 (FW-929)]|nr:hypothetical protein V495_01072 [Pseudogymnoascus sp. VKM F-4514 (FW-929)]KFY64748.1 hypothetical protein V497_01604 [Pseudogymnoascus sp. VKM F-4516 (FW-969)]